MAPRGDSIQLLELPPRARRIPAGEWFHIDTIGTTSACAENTCDIAGSLGHNRNYLRVRGEYTLPPNRISLRVELPPRARRIRGDAVTAGRHGGTTSACAENTGDRLGATLASGNYLRVRGEYH